MGVTHIDTLKRGSAYYPLYNADPGIVENYVPVYHNFGAIAALDNDTLIKAATSTELPNTETVTYTFPASSASPQDGVDNDGIVGTLGTLARSLVIDVTHGSSIVAMTIVITGTDIWGDAVVESVSVTATGTSKRFETDKAFYTVTSIAITAAGNAEANTLNIGIGNKIGLPFRIAGKNQVMPVINGKIAAPYTLNASVTAVGTAQDMAVVAPLGGSITAVKGVSAVAGLGSGGTSTVTVTNGSATVGTLAFTQSYVALDVISATIAAGSEKLAADGVIKFSDDGTGSHTGSGEFTVEVDPAVITASDDTAATATTGDIRGTVDFGGIPDGAITFGVWIFVDASTKALAFGTDQYTA